MFYSYQMMRDDFLVGLVPLAASSFLVLFAGLSFGAERVASPENAVHDGCESRHLEGQLQRGYGFG